MNKLFSKKTIPLLASSLSAIIGILVLWGWHTHNAALIQIRPNFAEMQYNSAFCFLVSGIALLAIHQKKRLLPFLLGMFVVGVSGLTLIEYIFNINIGIDQFFLKIHFSGQNLPLGRMSPNGALALSFIGLALVLLGYNSASQTKNKYAFHIAFTMGLLSLALSFVAIVGYMATLPETYGWRGYVQMAFHTACANIILSVGILFMAKAKAKESAISFSPWSPLFVFIGIAAMTLLFWDAAWIYIEKTKQKQNSMATITMKEMVHKDLESRIEALSRMVNRWKMRPGGTPYPEWRQDALNLIADEPGYQTLKWVDPQYRIRWVASLKTNDVPSNAQPLKKETLLPALQAAIEKNTITMTPILTLETNHKGFFLYAPIWEEKEFHGAIVGVIDAKSFFDEVFKGELLDYHIVVYENNHPIYQRDPYQGVPPPHQSVIVAPTGVDWSITSWIKPELLAKQHTWLPRIILFVGFLIALLLSLITHLAQIAKDSAARARKEIDRRKKTEHQLIVYSEKLKKLSLLDALTGTNNRRSLSKVLKEAIAQMDAEGMPFSILLLDIDHFKKINDTYGHVVGDNVLQKVGSTLRKKMRAIDTIARYGGEEFCIVLPNTLSHQAYEIADRLRLSVSEIIFYCEKKEPFQITCSIGVYQLDSRVKEVNKIFGIVDAALYKAKNSGRNCVVLEP